MTKTETSFPLLTPRIVSISISMCSVCVCLFCFVFCSSILLCERMRDKQAFNVVSFWHVAQRAFAHAYSYTLFPPYDDGSFFLRRASSWCVRIQQNKYVYISLCPLLSMTTAAAATTITTTTKTR